MIERFLRWFAKYRSLEESVKELRRDGDSFREVNEAFQKMVQGREAELSLLRIEKDGLKEQVEAYKTAVKEMGIERSSLQDRYVETREELRALQQDLLTMLKQSYENSRPPSKSSSDPAKPVLPARAQVYHKVNEQNREFFKNLESRLNDGGEIS